jgi:hypothetical protein
LWVITVPKSTDQMFYRSEAANVCP